MLLQCEQALTKQTAAARRQSDREEKQPGSNLSEAIILFSPAVETIGSPSEQKTQYIA